MKVLIEYLPVVAFFVAWKMYGIYVATVVIMVALVALVAGYWLIKREVSRMHVATAVLALIFGGLTLAVHDPLFIMIKPTVLYLLFAVALGVSAVVGSKTLIQRGLESQLSLPEPVWRRLNSLWIGFFLVCAVLNLVVALNFSEAVWVNFKLFGMLGLTLAFILAQGVYLAPHLSERDNQG